MFVFGKSTLFRITVKTEQQADLKLKPPGSEGTPVCAMHCIAVCHPSIRHSLLPPTALLLSDRTASWCCELCTYTAASTGSSSHWDRQIQ